MKNEQYLPLAHASLAIQWLNKAEIAKYYGCSLRHVHNLMSSRILPYVKIGRFVRFDLAACDSSMKQYQTKSILG